ncbi:MAG: gluconokinase [Schumannella sp.]|nr:gluconokinase [Schumannella sp.]
MGVSGSGKTTVGELLAAALGLRFADADALHPAANVAKMAAGIPLTDDDRWPWLDAVGQVLARGDVVVACSALRRAYRNRLRVAAPAFALVYLKGDREVLADRMGRRPGHFMPVTLLDSQLATLEPPQPDEHALTFDVALPADEIVAAAATELAAP